MKTNIGEEIRPRDWLEITVTLGTAFAMGFARLYVIRSILRFVRKH
jgi:hypothetical protein